MKWWWWWEKREKKELWDLSCNIKNIFQSMVWHVSFSSFALFNYKMKKISINHSRLVAHKQISSTTMNLICIFTMNCWRNMFRLYLPYSMSVFVSCFRFICLWSLFFFFWSLICVLCRSSSNHFNEDIQTLFRLSSISAEILVSQNNDSYHNVQQKIYLVRKRNRHFFFYHQYWIVNMVVIWRNSICFNNTNKLSLKLSFYCETICDIIELNTFPLFQMSMSNLVSCPLLIIWWNCDL